MRHHTYSGFIGFFLIQLLFLSPVISKAQSIQGSMPKDGSKNMIRNAFIAAGVDKSGIDRNSISANSVKLYPTSQPGSLVDAYITVDENVGNIILEPAQILAPNTSYTFEITGQLKDQAGNAYQPYQIEFQTGSIALTKHISTNRPKIVYQEKQVYQAQLSKVALAKMEPTKAVVPSTKSQSEITKQPDAVAENPDSNSANSEKAEVVVNMANQDKSEVQVEKSEEKMADSNSTVELSQNESTSEAENQDAINSKSNQTESSELAQNEAVAEKEEESEQVIPIVQFSKGKIGINTKLPVQFAFHQETRVRYVVKNAKGKIVKKGEGMIPAGQQNKSLSMKGLSKGSYIILLIAGDHKQSHRFQIK